jgi:hypothetical protein
MTLSEFISTLGRVIVNPLINLMFAAAIVYFLWGVAMYILKADDPGERQKGAKGIMYGVIGLVIMSSVFAIMYMAYGTVFR